MLMGNAISDDAFSVKIDARWHQFLPLFISDSGSCRRRGGLGLVPAGVGLLEGRVDLGGPGGSAVGDEFEVVVEFQVRIQPVRAEDDEGAPLFWRVAPKQ